MHLNHRIRFLILNNNDKFENGKVHLESVESQQKP
jgi:hypothetical protein